MALTLKRVLVSEEFVKKILEEKCRGLALLTNGKGETPLHIAAKKGLSNVAKLLVEHVKAFPSDIEHGIGAEQKFEGKERRKEITTDIKKEREKERKQERNDKDFA